MEKEAAIAPTCDTYGKTAVMGCLYCSYTEGGEVIEKLGHDYVAHITAPTCTEKGYTTYVCKNDEEHSYKDNEVSATGHTEGSPVVENKKAATCKETGSHDIVTYCSSCHEELERIVVTTEDIRHNLSYIELTGDFCGNIPIGRIYCLDCGETVSEYGHIYKVVIEKATCNKAGKEIHTCTECNTSYKKTLPALSHVHGSWIVVEEAKCNQLGKEIKQCLLCGEEVDQRAIDKPDHIFTSTLSGALITYECECGETYSEVAENSVVISFVSNGEKILEDLHVLKDKEIELPEPKSDKYIFAGWYYDDGLKNIYDNATFNKDTTLYAAWGVDTISGETSTNNIVLDAPLDFTFDVKFNGTLTDSNLNQYITISDIRGNIPKLYILSNLNGVYTIASKEYIGATTYQVFLTDDIEFAQIEGKELLFITVGEMRSNVKIKDGIVLIPEKEIYYTYSEDEKNYALFVKDMLNVGDVFVVYGESTDDISFFAEVVSKGLNQGFVEYELKEVKVEDVFDEYEQYDSGSVNIDEIVFDEDAEEELVENVKSSELYSVFKQAAVMYSASVSGFGKDKYELDDIKIHTDKGSSEGKFYINITLEAVFKKSKNSSESFSIKITIKNAYGLFYESEKSGSSFAFVMKTVNEIQYIVEATNTPDKERVEGEFFRLLRDAKEKGEFETIDPTVGRTAKKIVLTHIPVVIGALKATVDIGIDLEFKMAGDLEISYKSVVTSYMSIVVKNFIIFSANSSVDYKVESRFCLAGKIQFFMSPSIGLTLDLFSTCSVSATLVVGPYVEIGGVINVAYVDFNAEYMHIDGSIKNGIKLKLYAGVKIQFDLDWLELGTLKVVDKDWELLCVDIPLTFTVVGNGKVPLYFEKKDNYGVYDCDGTVDLKEIIDTTATFYYVDEDRIGIGEATDCLYFLNVEYENITLSQDGILKYNLPFGEVVDVQIKVVKNGIYKKIVVTLRHDHLAKESLYIAPTCKTEGRTAFTYCKNCLVVISGEDKAIERIDHDHKSRVVEPKCNKQGYTIYSCICGDTYTGDYTEPTGSHNFSAWIELASTCNGLAASCKFRVCMGCGFEEIVGDALGTHVIVTEYIEPTCTEKGYYKVSCANCSDVWYEDFIDHFGHAYTDWYIDCVPTCTTEGLKTRYCPYCELEETRIIPKLVHDFSEWKIHVSETCTSDGQDIRICTLCSLTQTRVRPKHTKTVVSVKNPTCTEKGYTVYICSCGKTFEDNYKEPLKHNWILATCLSPSFCTRCKLEEGKPLDHTELVEFSPAVDPTCENAGKTATFACQRFGCNYTVGGEEIEKLDHLWGAEHPMVSATCVEPGRAAYRVCGRENCQKVEGGEIIPIDSSAHKWPEDMCVAECEHGCGATRTPNHYPEADDGDCTTDVLCLKCKLVVIEGEKSHLFEIYEVTTEATCTQNEIKTYKCSRCDKTDIREVENSKKPHNLETISEAVSSTCVQEGKTAYEECKDCDYHEGGEAIPVDHNAHKWPDDLCVAECENGCGATRTPKHYPEDDDGDCTTAIKCSKCGEIVVKGYNEHLFENYISDNNATCTQNATETSKCSRCDKTDTKEVENSKPPHALETISEAVPPTCVQEGKTAYEECKDCDYHKGGEAIPVDHNAHKWPDDLCVAECENGCGATRTPKHYPEDDDGDCTTAIKCSKCGEIVVKGYNEHLFENYISDNNATCTQNATETSKCSRCDKTDTKEVENSKPPHALETISEAVPPTCVQEGKTVYKECKDCDYHEGGESIPVDLNAHTWSEDLCVAECENGCGALRTPQHDPEDDDGDCTTAVFCANCKSVVKKAFESHLFEYTSNNDATCVKDGTKTANCSHPGCNKEHTIIDEGSLDPNKHSWDNDCDTDCNNGCGATRTPKHNPEDDDGDCTTDVLCSICKEVVKKGHEIHLFENYKSNNNATCTKNETETSKCSRCDKTEEREIADSKKPHTLQTISEAVSATCMQEGKTAHKKCQYCEYEEKPESIPVNPTAHKYSSLCDSDCDNGCGATRIPQHYPEADDGDCTTAIKCSKCGVIVVEKYNKHLFENYILNNNATCTQNATKTSKCSRCDKTDEIEIEGTKHDNFVEVEPEIPATCVKEGLTAQLQCVVCGKKTEREAIPKNKNHDLETVSKYEPTCTSNGYEEFVICTRNGCGYSTYNSSLDIPKLGFTAKRVEDKYKKSDANCMDSAVYYYSCEKCGKCGTDTFEYGGKGDHVWVENTDEEYLIDEATCKKLAKYAKSCEKCLIEHSTETFESGELAKHDVGPWKDDIPESCTEPGRKHRICYNCGDEVESEEIPATGHSHEETVYPPTCLEDGYTEYICSSCKDTYRDDITPKLEHAPKAEWNTENPAFHYHECKYSYDRCREIFAQEVHTMDTTLTVSSCDGGFEYNIKTYCTVCNYEESSEKSFVHTCSGGEVIAGKRPTCLEKGLTPGLKCNGCDVIIAEQKEIDRIDHVFIRGFCCWCGEPEESEGLEFTSNGDGTCYVSGIGTCTDTDINIPSIYNGMLVTSIGKYAFYNCKSITSVTIPNSVTSIGSSAFSWCDNLTSVTIPDSVTSIGSSAFYYCSSLTSVIIPNSVTSIDDSAFYYCSSLTSVIIPNSVTSISNCAFYSCSSLTSVTIGDSVTSIAAAAFYKCTSLTSVYIDDIASWCNIAFDSGDSNPLYYAKNLYLKTDFGTYELVTDLVIPDSVKSIGNYAFGDCTSLTSVTIPNSVMSIGYYAFSNCTSLTSVTIGDSVTSIGVFAFGNCTSLTSVTIGDSVTSIGKYAFYDCDSLTSVTIPDSVTSIGNYAFSGCSHLTSVTIGNSVTSISAYAFEYCTSLTSVYIDDIASWCNIEFADYYSNPLYYAKNLYLKNGSGTYELVINLVIPDGVTSIGSYAFYSCDNLTSVTIPNSVTSIGSYAFYNCTSLTSIIVDENNANYKDIDGNLYTKDGKILIQYAIGKTDKSVIIPDSVTSIGSGAFYNCYSLTSVTIPDSVTSVGSSAFCWCTSLTSVTIGNSVTSISSYAFEYCTSLTSVTIGDSVTSIGVSAFYNTGYYNIQSNWENDVLYIGKYLIDAKNDISGDYVIKEGTKVIADIAFRDCTSLTSVIIPNSVTNIGVAAFDGCENFTSVIIPDSVTSISSYAFRYCTSLTSVMIPDSVKSIGSSAFFGCKSLMSVTIPKSVTSIGSGAFYNCDGLTSVTIGDSVTSIGEEAFYACYALTSVEFKNPNGWTAGSTVISSADLADTATAAGYLSANYCYCEWNRYSQGLEYSLDSDGKGYTVTGIGTCTDTDLIIPPIYNGLPVKSIGDYAFEDCTSLTSVTIPNSVTSIGYGAFKNCTGLTSVTIGDSVTSIGSYAFEYCSNLTSINVDENNANYKDIDGNLYTKDGKTLIQYAIGKIDESFVIPDSVTSIGDYAFYNCSSLTSVTIPNSVTSIGSSAFAWCESLTSVTIPDSVNSIGNYAFHDCTSLASVTIPNSVMSIGSGAFYNCYSLTSVTIPDSVTSIGEYAFFWCTDLTSVTIGDSVTSIGSCAFYYCDSLTSAEFKNPNGWTAGSTVISSADLADTATAATYLKGTYSGLYWTRSEQ